MSGTPANANDHQNGEAGGAVSSFLKASIAYVPALIVVCGVFAQQAQQRLFGLQTDSFDLNAAVSAGIAFFIDLASETTSALASVHIGSLTIVAFAVCLLILGLAVLMMKRCPSLWSLWRKRCDWLGTRLTRTFAVWLLALVLLVVSAWRMVVLDLPANFLANVFTYDPTVLVQANHVSPLFSNNATNLWHSLVCKQIPLGLPASSSDAGIDCSNSGNGGNPLKRNYQFALLIAIVTGGLGLCAVRWSTNAVRGGAFLKSLLILTMAYNLLATPYLYGRLIMRTNFPELYVYVRAGTSSIPNELKPLFELHAYKNTNIQRNTQRLRVRQHASSPSIGQSLLRIYGYLLGQRNDVLSLLIPVSVPCDGDDGDTAWRWYRLEISKSDVSMVEHLHVADEQGTLMRRYLTLKACPADRPPRPAAK